MLVKICVPVIGQTLKEFLSNLQNAQNASDCVELRVDYIKNLQIEDLKKIKAQTHKESIFTCRPTWEGGLFDQDEKTRLKMLKKGAELGFDHVDIELQTYEQNTQEIKQLMKNKGQTQIIISNHNFQETPSNCQLEEIIKRIRDTGADIVKFASMCNSELDSQRLLKLAANKHVGERVVILGMGEYGKPTRVAMPLVGGYLTFASLGKQATAPGQIDIEELIKIYKTIQPE